MQRTNTNTEVVDQVESEPFRLVLPPDLTQSPKWNVKLSPKRSALIYAEPYATKDGGSSTRYDLMIIDTKTGTRDGNYMRCSQYTTLHEVQHYLVDISHQLNIKKRTRRTIEVDESSDD